MMSNWLPQLSMLHWISFHGLVMAVGLLTYITASHTLHQRRHPSAAIAWMVALALLPYLALPLYLVFGNRKVVAARQARDLPPSDRPAQTPGPTRTRQLAAALGLPVAAPYAQLRVHADGAQALQALLQGMDNATRTLDVCTFILGRDGLSQALAARLAQRAPDRGARAPVVGRRGLLRGRHAAIEGTARGRRAGGAVRAATGLGTAWPHQPAQSPQDDAG